MTETEVIEAKRLRRAARSVFKTQRDLVKIDLSSASVGQRVFRRIADDGRILADEAIDAAGRHKAVVTAGALAVTAWFLRKPLIALAASVFVAGNGEEAEGGHEQVKQGRDRADAAAQRV